MKRFILHSVALCFAVLPGFTSDLYAGPQGVPHPAHMVAHVHAPVVLHGHAFHGAFHVRGYRGWISRCWFPSIGCYGYYCGADQTWYYWYAPFDEYLPISYMSMYPPTPMGVAPANVIPATPGSLALPPGASLVPGPITAP